MQALSENFEGLYEWVNTVRSKKTKTRDMPNAKHKEKVKETSDVLKDCREVLHDGSNEIVAQIKFFHCNF
jgi:hypothetical protein